MKSIVFCVFILLPTICLAEEHFQYGGVGLNTSPNSFKEMFPTSNVYGDSVRISTEDSRDNVYYIKRHKRAGREAIIISFERPFAQLPIKPTTFKESHYMRHPKCNDIFKRLIQTYGEPNEKSASQVEVRIHYHKKVWYTAKEKMELHCYNIDGKGELLSSGVNIFSR